MSRALTHSMQRSIRFAELTLGAIAITLGGCAVTRPAEQPATLRVSPSFAMARSGPVQGTLSLAPVIARGSASELRYSYIDRDAPREVRQAKSLFWEEPPPRLVERALVDGLSARVGPVAAPDAPAVTDRRLVVRLRRFEEVTGGEQDTVATVAMDANLLKGDKSLVFSGTYCASEPVRGASPSARALAFESALKASVTRLADDVAHGAAANVTGC